MSVAGAVAVDCFDRMGGKMPDRLAFDREIGAIVTVTDDYTTISALALRQ